MTDGKFQLLVFVSFISIVAIGFYGNHQVNNTVYPSKSELLVINGIVTSFTCSLRYNKLDSININNHPETLYFSGPDSSKVCKKHSLLKNKEINVLIENGGTSIYEWRVNNIPTYSYEQSIEARQAGGHYLWFIVYIAIFVAIWKYAEKRHKKHNK